MNYIQNIFKKENTGKVLSDLRYVKQCNEFESYFILANS